MVPRGGLPQAAMTAELLGRGPKWWTVETRTGCPSDHRSLLYNAGLSILPISLSLSLPPSLSSLSPPLSYSLSLPPCLALSLPFSLTCWGIAGGGCGGWGAGRGPGRGEAAPEGLEGQEEEEGGGIEVAAGAGVARLVGPGALAVVDDGLRWGEVGVGREGGGRARRLG